MENFPSGYEFTSTDRLHYRNLLDPRCFFIVFDTLIRYGPPMPYGFLFVWFSLLSLFVSGTMYRNNKRLEKREKKKDPI